MTAHMILFLFLFLSLGPMRMQFHVGLPVESGAWCHAYLQTPEPFRTPGWLRMVGSCADAEGNIVEPQEDKPA